MQEEIQKIDPFDNAPRTGILGRGVKTLLNKYGLCAGAVSINQPSYAVYGDIRDEDAPLPLILGEDGGQCAFARPPNKTFDPMSYIQKLNGPNELSSNLYSETWSQLLINLIYENDKLTNAVKGQDLSAGAGFEC
jgi:hypothetical protein